AEGAVLVDADLRGQPQHALGDDVAQDLVGAAGDAHPRRAEVSLLPERLLRREPGVDDRAHRALELPREPRDLLPERRPAGLAHRALGPGRRAAGERRERAVARVLEALRAHVEVGELLAHRVVLDRGAAAEARLAREAEELAQAAAPRPRADRDALVHQRRQRDAPAVADGAEPVRIGAAHVAEEPLVEARGAVDLADRPDLDPRRVHVEEEVGEPRVLRRVGIRARHDHPEVAVVRAGAPDLLAVEHPGVAVAHRGRAQPREVAPGVGLAEELAPDDLPARHLAHGARLLLGRAVRHQRRAEHAVADRVEVRRGLEAALLLAPDHLLEAPEVLSAVLLRPGEAGPARLELEQLPRLRAPDRVRILALAQRIGSRRVGRARLCVRLEPRARPDAERGLLRGVVEVHRRLLGPRPSGRLARLEALDQLL